MIARLAKRLSGPRAIVVGLCSALVLVIAVEAFVLIADSRPSKPADRLDELWSGHYDADRERWKEAIEESGARRAYADFVADTAGKSFGVAHTLAHIMGELVYESEGLDGVAVCDGSFGFGCYHSFFGKAISEHGIDVAEELDRACVRQWGPIGLGCPHGIGHGIQGYFGDEGLLASLEICDRLSWKGPIGGCSSGVFMEYNFHTMDSLEGAESRPFNPAKPLYPCDSVGERFSQSCYFELPAWLVTVLRGDFSSVGGVCAKASSEGDRAACYKGAGVSAAEGSSYDVSAIVASCSLMPGRVAEVLCRSGASWAFYAQPSERPRRGAPCEGLSSAEESLCLEESEIVRYEGPSPVR